MRIEFMGRKTRNIYAKTSYHMLKTKVMVRNHARRRFNLRKKPVRASIINISLSVTELQNINTQPPA